MARSNANQQVERGLLSPNTAGKLMGFSPNSVRGWIKKGHLRRLKLPFVSDIQVSAFELLMIAIRWKLPFNPQLWDAAKSYIKNFEPDPENLTKLEVVEIYYKEPKTGEQSEDTITTYISELIELSTRPLPTITFSKP